MCILKNRSNIYMESVNNVYCQSHYITKDTNSAHILADHFIYTYEYDFHDSLKTEKTKGLGFTGSTGGKNICDIDSSNNDVITKPILF